MKLIVAGSRSIKSYETVRQAIMSTGLWGRYRHDMEIVCGMADGADLLGLEFAKKNNLKWYEMPADWNNLSVPDCVIKYNKYKKPYNANAGFSRNKDMGNFADELLAIWDGSSRGTKQMIDYMRYLGKPVHIYYLGAKNEIL